MKCKHCWRVQAKKLEGRLCGWCKKQWINPKGKLPDTISTQVFKGCKTRIDLSQYGGTERTV